MSPDLPRLEPFGDAALLVRFGERIDLRLNEAVHALAAEIRAERERGRPWGAPVPAYASLLVPYDILRLGLDEASAALGEIVARLTGGPDDAVAEPPQQALEIPVRYGGRHGPDLSEVAERCGLGSATVVELHASVTYRAHFLGFAPGFAYLATLPGPLQLPRRDTPRARVPAGSVAIAGPQTAVYPLSTPGGWHLIGRTDVALWDPSRNPAALISAGRHVRFVPQAG